jgi:hypothetical protein
LDLLSGSKGIPKELKGFYPDKLWLHSSSGSLKLGPEIGLEFISEKDFCCCQELRHVSMKGFKSVHGFKGCCFLERLEISGEMIGKAAFKSCEALKQVFFREDCEMKEIRGFRKCFALERIQIPASVVMINEDAFAKCRSLKEVVFEKESELLECHGFRRCVALTALDMPPSVEKINGLTGLQVYVKVSEKFMRRNQRRWHVLMSIKRRCSRE